MHCRPLNRQGETAPAADVIRFSITCRISVPQEIPSEWHTVKYRAGVPTCGSFTPESFTLVVNHTGNRSVTEGSLSSVMALSIIIKPNHQTCTLPFGSSGALFPCSRVNESRMPSPEGPSLKSSAFTALKSSTFTASASAACLIQLPHLQAPKEGGRGEGALRQYATVYSTSARLA